MSTENITIFSNFFLYFECIDKFSFREQKLQSTEFPDAGKLLDMHAPLC